MGIFRRKPELDQLHARKSLLEKQLATAERELAAAVEARQKALLEGDLDTPLDGQSANGLVGRLHDEKAAILTALSTMDERIAEAENRLTAERDRSKREAAAKELSSAADALDGVADEVAAALAKIPGVLDDVLNRLPLPHLILKANVQSFANAIVEALRTEVGEARRYTTMLAEGDAAVVLPRTEDAPPPPAPPIERQTIFLLGRSRWEENGETITSGPHVTTSPPIKIAKLAIQHGHAIEAGSPLAVTLQMRSPPNYAVFPASDCLDISKPKPVTKPVVTPTATPPVFHSEFAHARGGVASVARNPR
jgi:hypothetical protein